MPISLRLSVLRSPCPEMQSCVKNLRAMLSKISISPSSHPTFMNQMRAFTNLSMRAPVHKANALVCAKSFTIMKPSGHACFQTNTRSFLSGLAFPNTANGNKQLLGIRHSFPNLFTQTQNRNMGTARSLKTRKAVSKRFLKTGNGGLKRGHPGKRHNTSKKNRVRLRRLNEMTHMKGTWLKKMKMLFNK